jgi:hypothetical protein
MTGAALFVAGYILGMVTVVVVAAFLVRNEE